jgi:sporulation protein YlmC with PRC-barrel domain
MRRKALWMAAVAAGVGTIYGADVEVKSRIDTDKPKVEAEVKRDGDRSRAEYRQEARIESPVKAINKASGLIGMSVHNRQDERVGEIKDIVFDIQSGKIGYVVMATGGGVLGIGEKLLAVPANSFTPSEQKANLLILDATKGDIVDAPGIASTNWPDPRKTDDVGVWRPRNRGSAPASETGRTKLYTEPGKVEVKTERK